MSTNSNNYIAHTSDDGRVQSVKEHLEQTAELSAENALPEFKELAQCCGLYHDLGKYSPEFQKYIRDSGQRVEHARFGASRIINNCQTSYAVMLAYCVCGHHAGLPDGGVRNDNPEQSTLNAMLKREQNDCSGFDKEIGDWFPDDPLFEELKKLPTRNGFAVPAPSAALTVILSPLIKRSARSLTDLNAKPLCKRCGASFKAKYMTA